MQLQVLETYIGDDKLLQADYAEFLDSLCAMKEDTVAEMVSNQGFNVKDQSKLQHKTLIKMAEKVVKRYELDPDDYPNVFDAKNIAGLCYLVRQKCKEERNSKNASYCQKWDNLIETAVSGKPLLQIKLVHKLAGMGNIADACKYAKKYYISPDKLPMDVIEALQWCRSFLTNRTQRVKINGHYSESIEVKYGAPQGSVWGPKCYNIYVRGQPVVIQNRGFKSTAFADDSNGKKKFAITFQYNALKNDIPHLINEITEWMNSQGLKINEEKTEIIVFYPKSLTNQVIIGGTIVGEECIRFSKVVKNVGVWLDEQLNFEKHINQIVSHCYKLLRDIGRIRNILSKKH